jgi:Uma2 family endonuclease
MTGIITRSQPLAPRPPQEQRFILAGVSWAAFKIMQQGFQDTQGVRLFYCDGELEILSTSPEHEIISRFITLLLGIYFEELGIEFTPTGAMTQEVTGRASVQADESYILGGLAAKSDPVIPDLAVEVVITSGGPDKLQRYQVLQVPEVWFWEDGVFELYYLGTNGYDRIYQSHLLPELNLEALTRCVLMAQTSRLEAMREFRRVIQTQR